MEYRELLQAIERQCLVMSGNIYDMTKELESMNEKVSELKHKVKDAIDKSEHEQGQ